jgi:hypothetical protein
MDQVKHPRSSVFIRLCHIITEKEGQGLVGELNALNQFIPDRDVFLNMHSTKEAVLSNCIEGVRTNLTDRYNRSSTLLVSPYRLGDGPSRFQDPTPADAILNRLVHHAHRIKLVFPSQPKLRSGAFKSTT